MHRRLKEYKTLEIKKNNVEKLQIVEKDQYSDNVLQEGDDSNSNSLLNDETLLAPLNLGAGDSSTDELQETPTELHIKLQKSHQNTDIG